jgi:chaperonin GroEL (HSP60 family)
MSINIGDIDSLKQSFFEISEIIKKTMGVKGGYTILKDNFNFNYSSTKDGYTVLKNLVGTTKEEEALLSFVKNISFNMVRTVGDGSSSAVLISYKLFNNLNKIVDNYPYIPKIIIVEILNFLFSDIKEEIKKYATSIDLDKEESKDIIYKIAFNATNGNEEISNLLASTFYENKISNILVSSKMAHDNEHEIIINNSFEHNRGLISDKMLKTKNFTKFENSKIFVLPFILTNNFLQTLVSLLNINNENIPIVIVCNGFTNDFKTNLENLILANNGKFEFNIAIVDAALSSEEARRKVEDLRFLSNQNSEFKDEIDFEIFVKTLNNVSFKSLPLIKDFKATLTNSIFSGFEADEEKIKVKINELKEDYTKIRNTNYEKEKAILDLRISRLRQKTATIFVAGINDQAKESIKYAIDDASAAISSALKYGWNLSGNVLVPLIIYKNFENILEKANTYFQNKYEYLFFEEKEIISNILLSLRKTYINTFEDVSLNIIHNKDISEEVLEKLFNKIISINNFNYNKVQNKYDMILSNVTCKVFNDGNYIFNNRTMKIEEKDKTSVISSIETDIEIINSVLSIINLIFPSNSIII